MSEDNYHQELVELEGFNPSLYDAGVKSVSAAATNSSRLDLSTTRNRFSPYPTTNTSAASSRHASTSLGASTASPGRSSTVPFTSHGSQASSSRSLPPSRARVYPVARLSWFPTPETLSAARKGNLGHWTGKMERMWLKRVEEILMKSGKPKTASG